MSLTAQHFWKEAKAAIDFQCLQKRMALQPIYNFNDYRHLCNLIQIIEHRLWTLDRMIDVHLRAWGMPSLSVWVRNPEPLLVEARAKARFWLEQRPLDQVHLEDLTDMMYQFKVFGGLCYPLLHVLQVDQRRTVFLESYFRLPLTGKPEQLQANFISKYPSTVQEATEPMEGLAPCPPPTWYCAW